MKKRANNIRINEHRKEIDSRGKSASTKLLIESKKNRIRFGIMSIEEINRARITFGIINIEKRNQVE